MPYDPFYTPKFKPPTALKVASDGGSSAYYQLPPDAKELGDLIEAKNMDFNLGNIFKACYRLGEKNDPSYEINKIIWFADRMKKQNDRRKAAK
jgi:hypothetical protein